MMKQAEKASRLQIHIYIDLSSVEVIRSSKSFSMRFPQEPWVRSANWTSIECMEKTYVSGILQLNFLIPERMGACSF